MLVAWILDVRPPSPQEFFSLFKAAGILIVLPTYLLITLPFSVIVSLVPGPKFRLAWWPMFLCLFFIGGLGTCFYLLLDHLVEHVSFQARDVLSNPVLYLLPFLPYSLVVVWLTAKMAKCIKPHKT